MLFLSKNQRDVVRNRLEEARCEALTRRIRTAFEQELVRWDETELRAQVRRSVDRTKQLGFREEQFITYFVIWDIFLGEGFEARDPDGELIAILHQDRAEPMKFHDFRTRMDTLLSLKSERFHG
jgi:hypothetical protein